MPTDSLVALKEKLSQFTGSLPHRVDPASVSMKTKIPFKALTHREALIHRMTELADSAHVFYSVEGKAISAFVLTRASQETLALLFVLFERMESVVNGSDVSQFDQFIMTNTFGYRIKGDDELPEMPNILNAIDRIDKAMGGSFRRSYETLSEYCHPNCSGVQAAYVKIDRDNIWADIGSRHTNIPVDHFIGVLVACLEMFEMYYNNISDLMPRFIKACEDDLART